MIDRVSPAVVAREGEPRVARPIGTSVNEMSRGEMIRRLDQVAAKVQARLAAGPLTSEEQHALAVTLGRLLPAVATSLQDQEDREAAAALARSFGSAPPDGGDKPLAG
jgi:hypothetical protein